MTSRSYGDAATAVRKVSMEGVDSDEDRLLRLRPLLVRGQVFAVDDGVSRRTMAGKLNRPMVLVIVSPIHARSAIALEQHVALSARLSWKPEWGTPGSPAAQALLRTRKWIFSSKGSLPAFNKDGIFELDNRLVIRIADLIRCKPLGWLPEPAISAILAHAGARLAYPPVPG